MQSCTSAAQGIIELRAPPALLNAARDALLTRIPRDIVMCIMPLLEFRPRRYHAQHHIVDGHQVGDDIVFTSGGVTIHIALDSVTTSVGFPGVRRTHALGRGYCGRWYYVPGYLLHYDGGEYTALRIGSDGMITTSAIHSGLNPDYRSVSVLPCGLVAGYIKKGAITMLSDFSTVPPRHVEIPRVDPESLFLDDYGEPMEFGGHDYRKYNYMTWVRSAPRITL